MYMTDFMKIVNLNYKECIRHINHGDIYDDHFFDKRFLGFKSFYRRSHVLFYRVNIWIRGLVTGKG